MTDLRTSRLAQLLVNYCVAVQPEDRVFIFSSFSARPLAVETYREVLRAGAHPLTVFQDEEFDELLLKEGNEAQIALIPEPVSHIYEEYDVMINLMGAVNTRALSGVDPQRQRLRAAAVRPLIETSMRRTAAGEYRWVVTLFPTPAYAQEADMSLLEFENFVYKACQVHESGAPERWKARSDQQQRLVEWLLGKEQVRVEGPNVDLTLSIAGRSFINDGGERNMPGGEIFTAPVEDSVNGWVRFTYPAIHGGREVNGVELRFANGKVVEASAEKNEAYLQQLLDADPGARYLGEFAIGTNDGIERFTKSILFDEKIGGTIHMAVGAGYPETGSKNKSGIHWDMICDMRDSGRIWVDDELFYESGNFTILDELPGTDHA